MNRKNRKIINWIGLSAFILVAFGFAPVYGQAKSAAMPAASEKPLPNLVLNTINGREWSLYENRGRVVLLNFWATWCEPCHTETPLLVELSREFKPRGLEVVGIALDENTENIKRFVAEYKIEYPILLPVPDSRLARIEPVPTTLLIDEKGRLAKKYVGLIPEETLRADVENLIEKLPLKKPGSKEK